MSEAGGLVGEGSDAALTDTAVIEDTRASAIWREWIATLAESADAALAAAIAYDRLDPTARLDWLQAIEYDTRGLEPVSVLATYPLILIGSPKVPYGNFADMLAFARANPGKINYGHQGKANTGHLLGELLMLKGNFRMTEIPYRGSAPAINDLLAGNIDLVPDYLLSNKANIDAGKLKFLATAARERPKGYPNVATVAETLPGVYADTWMAVAAPPGTPKDIAKKISDAIGQGFRQPDLRARILALEAEPLGSTPEQMRDMIKQSLATWEPVVNAAKISVD